MSEKTTSTEIESEIGFLIVSAKNFVKNMEHLLESKEIEEFLRAFKQFHRIVGEIFALIRFVKSGSIGNKNTESSADALLLELEELLRKATELEEEYINLLRKGMTSHK